MYRNDSCNLETGKNFPLITDSLKSLANIGDIGSATNLNAREGFHSI